MVRSREGRWQCGGFFGATHLQKADMIRYLKEDEICMVF